MAPTRKLASLFWELRVRAESIPKDLATVERGFGRLTKFIIANPVAAITAVGTAMLGVAVKAAKMAADVERGLLRVRQATGGSVEQVKALRAEIEAMSKATGRSQAELAQAAALAAKSAGSTAEVGQRLSAALELSQATGEDLTGIISNMDAVLDVFNLSADKSTETLAKLFATARGKQPIDDLFATITTAGPALVRMGLDVDTATRALTALGEQLGSPKAASAEFKKLSLLGDEGRKEILRLAASIPIATNALGELKKAADEANNSSEALNERLKADLAANLITLGNKILPLVNAELKGMVGLFDLLSGRAGAIEANSALATVTSIGPLVEKLEAQGQRGAKGLKDLTGALQDVIIAVREGNLKLADLDVTQLERLRTALVAIQGSDKIRMLGNPLAPMLAAIEKLIAQAPKAADAVAKVTGTTGGGLGSDRIKANQDAAKASAKAIEDGLQEELKAVNAALDAQVAARKAANEKILAAQKDATKKLAEMAGDTVKVLEIELADIVEEFKGASDAERDLITKPLQIAITAAQELKGALARIEIPDDVRKKLGLPLKEAKKDAKDYADALEAARAATERTANAIANVGNALLSVAGALGVVDQKTQSIGRGAINLGAGIATRNPVQIIGGVADIITGITSGNEAAEQRHQDNIAALRAIERHTGDLVGKNVTGTQFSDAQRGVAAVLAGGTIDPRRPSEIRGSGAILRGLGLTMEDLQEIANQWDITLDGSIESWLAFDAALKKADMFAFTETFASQMERLERQFEIFGDAFDEPAERFAAFVKLLNDPKVGAPALFGALEGLDSATAEGRDAIRKIIQDLFTRAVAGEITAEERNGLTNAQFLDVLAKINRDLGVAAADALERQLANERELAEARARGASEAELAQLELEQALEETARAARDAADAALEAAAAIEAAAAAERRRADFAEAINIEFLRATGQEQAADRAELDTRHNRRVEAAAQAGFSQAVIDQINAIRDAELKDFEKRWAGVVDVVGDAIGAVDGGSAERSSIASAAQGLSERTGNRMADYLASGLVLQRQMVDLLSQIAGGTSTGVLIQPPALSTILPAPTTVTGGLTINVGDIITRVDGSVSDPKAVGDLIGDSAFQRIVQRVSQELARQAINANRLAGNVSLPPS